MRAKHWHVAIGQPNGAAYAVSEYSDPAQAVRDFLKLSGSIYVGQIENPLELERQVVESTTNDENFYIALGLQQPLMIFCTVCDCEFLSKSN